MQGAIYELHSRPKRCHVEGEAGKCCTDQTVKMPHKTRIFLIEHVSDIQVHSTYMQALQAQTQSTPLHWVPVSTPPLHSSLILRGALGRVYWKLKANFICVLAGTVLFSSLRSPISTAVSHFPGAS